MKYAADELEAGCNHFHQIRGLAIREFADGTSLAMYTLSCVPAEGYAKIDGSGRDLWNSGPKVPDRATSIAPVQSLTDEFIACGYNSNSGSSYIEKFSDVGWRQWIKDLGLSGLKVVVPCVDGGYIVGGSSQLLKTDPSGDYIAPAETTSTMNNQAAMFPHLRGSK